MRGLARMVREEAGLRLALTVDHDGTVQLSSCDSCARDAAEVLRILDRVRGDLAAHPDGGDAGRVP